MAVYDKNGKLSREEMEKVIREGGSITIQGVIVNKIENLPSKAWLAKGDPAAEAKAEADLKAEVAKLQAQIDSIKAEQAAAVSAAVGAVVPPAADDAPPPVDPPKDPKDQK